VDLRHDPPGFLPALRLIAEAGEVAAHLVRRSPNRALEQVSDPVLQDPVGRPRDRITHTLGFEELVDLGVGEGRVATEIETLQDVPVKGDPARQSSALWRFPDRRAHRSTPPSWLNTNSRW